MKKVYCVITLLICMVFMSFGQEVKKQAESVQKNVTEATAAVYNDVTNATATVYTDAKNATVAVYPDAKGAINTLYTDSKKAIDYLVPKVESAITALAAGLKTTASEVWRILVYKQVALAVTALVYFLLAICLLIASIVGIRRTMANVKANGGYCGDFGIVVYVVGGILIVLSLVAMTQQIPIMVNGFIIPEAGALKEARDMTKELLKAF